MKTQEEYAREIDEIVRRDVESCQIDWFKIDKEIFMLPENKNKIFILGTRKTGCDLLILGGTNCDERREETHNTKMMKERAKICELYDKQIRKAEVGKKIILCVFDHGLSVDNVIYYNHTNTLVFNWCDHIEKITKEKFDDFVNNVDRSRLPEGIKFELK